MFVRIAARALFLDALAIDVDMVGNLEEPQGREEHERGFFARDAGMPDQAERLARTQGARLQIR